MPTVVPSGFWSGVTVRELRGICPDQGGILDLFADDLSADDLSRELGGVPAEEASMWYCILKSQGVVSIPDGADVGSLREEASAFEFKHGFSPNVGT